MTAPDHNVVLCRRIIRSLWILGAVGLIVAVATWILAASSTLSVVVIAANTVVFLLAAGWAAVETHHLHRDGRKLFGPAD